MSLNKKQPDPINNHSKHIWDLVIRDMRERDKVGAERYGTHLQAFNGRSALVDAYQEALDLVVYLRQKIEEDGMKCDYCKGHCCQGFTDPDKTE